MDRERVQRQDNGTGREVPVSDGDVGSASGADDIVTAKNGGGGAACRSGVTIGRPSCSIRPRSTRKKKPTLKAVSEL